MAITRAQQVRQMYKKGSMEPVKQAGVMNYMPSEMVTVPKIAKSSPDTPTAKLAYITPEEQDILVDLNLYGSLKGKPNRGPGGIPSLEGDFFTDLSRGGSQGTYDSPAQSFTDSVPSSSYDAPTGAVDDPFKGAGQSPNYFTTTNTTGYDEETGVTTPSQTTIIDRDGDGVVTVNDLDTLYRTGVPKSNFPGVIGLGLNLLKPVRDRSLKVNIDYFRGLENIDRSMYPETADGYRRYMKDRLAGKIDAAGNTIISTDNNNNNFIPVDTTFAQAPGDMDQGTDTTEEEEGLRLAFRADGGRIGAQEGGIMGGLADGQMDEMGRQMYGLGKLVKKATRAVKKIVKSPIGKAALIAGGGYLLGGGTVFGKALPGIGTSGGFAFRNILPNLIGVKESGGVGVGFEGILGKLGLTKGFGSAMPTALGGILGTSVAAAALTPDEENQAQQIADETGIDIEEVRNSILAARREQYAMDARARGFKADGGLMRLGYQEGSKEPVAKKTMPLLDMGGKEMDLRENGGFVPIGRMEKADDVPARLSKNEFVFTADAVRNAGDGDVDKGAEVMYNMMKNLESGGDVSEESQGLEGARRMFQTSQRLEEVL